MRLQVSNGVKVGFKGQLRLITVLMTFMNSFTVIEGGEIPGSTAPVG